MILLFRIINYVVVLKNVYYVLCSKLRVSVYFRMEVGFFFLVDLVGWDRIKRKEGSWVF